MGGLIEREFPIRLPTQMDSPASVFTIMPPTKPRKGFPTRASLRQDYCISARSSFFMARLKCSPLDRQRDGLDRNYKAESKGHAGSDRI